MRTLQELMSASAPFAKEDPKRSWWHLISTAIVLAVLIAGTLSPLPLVLRILMSLFAGGVVVRMFIIYHDYQHGAIFRSSKLAKPFMNCLGILVLNPPNIWNRSHNYHHSRNSQIATASIGSFPIMTVSEYNRAPFSVRLRYRLSRSPLPFLSGHVIIFVLGMCLSSFVKDPRKHWDSLVALLVHLGFVWVLASVSLSALVLAYLLPLYMSCMLGAYLFYIQHNFPTMQLKPREEWTFLFAALNSSSFMEGSPLIHWLTGNIGYHHVHHLNSRIPFYRLPEAMAAIPELQNPGRTSLRPRDIASCMRLKLWDPEQHRMVSFAEARPVRQRALSGAH
ncbi:MAG: fatty acid desaturase [Bdellovibrionaceae bacterium]|nr:fatty acid desaturase [Bdellovibrionales bacterium]MCB9255320.1 fatty acid desaturase [Pseudobdellovibrionaceae bacterium]